MNPTTTLFRKAIKTFEAKRGTVTLAALLRRRNGLGRWDLVVAAPWIEGRTLKAMRDVLGLLKTSVGRRGLEQVSRIILLRPRDPMVKSLLDIAASDRYEFRLRSTELFGVDMDDAVILHAKQPRPNGARRPRPVAVASSRVHR